MGMGPKFTLAGRALAGSTISVLPAVAADGGLVGSGPVGQAVIVWANSDA